jgi:hypothetical protein
MKKEKLKFSLFFRAFPYYGKCKSAFEALRLRHLIHDFMHPESSAGVVCVLVLPVPAAPEFLICSVINSKKKRTKT